MQFPLFLTCIRLLIAPTVLPFLLYYGLPSTSFVVHIGLAFLIVLLSLTDFFDGYLARKYQQETVLGRILDPIADKCLLYSILIPLVAVHKLYFYAAIIFIGREFFVMSLRLIALEYQLKIHVSLLAKLKTTLQMLYSIVAVINMGSFMVVETLLLFAALVVSIWSAYHYTKYFIYAYCQQYQ